MRLFLRVVALGFLGFMLLAAELSLIGVQQSILKLRQPTIGAAVDVPGSPLREAQKWAERLDEQVPALLKANHLSYWQRWSQGLNVGEMNNRYTQDMIAHLTTMTEVFRARRAQGGYRKLKEFEFQSLLRKSDYLLALPMTQTSFAEAAKYSHLRVSLKKALNKYNGERVLHDEKIFVITDFSLRPNSWRN